MEINQEALDALSLADVIAVKNELSDSYEENGNPHTGQAFNVLKEEYKKRLKNIFIF